MPNDLTAEIAETLAHEIADHPMWIGDDGEGLDYLPEREARIASFVRNTAALIAERLAGLRGELADRAAMLGQLAQDHRTQTERAERAEAELAAREAAARADIRARLASEDVVEAVAATPDPWHTPGTARLGERVARAALATLADLLEGSE